MTKPISNPTRKLFIDFLRRKSVNAWPGATTLWLLPRAEGGYEDYMGTVYGAADLPALRTAQGGNVEVLELTADAWRAYRGGNS